jgi:hypothetical protein
LGATGIRISKPVVINKSFGGEDDHSCGDTASLVSSVFTESEDSCKKKKEVKKKKSVGNVGKGMRSSQSKNKSSSKAGLININSNSHSKTNSNVPTKISETRKTQ